MATDRERDDIRVESGIESLMRCPDCNQEMRLFGIEAASDTRELYSFECDQCRRIEIRGVRIG
jgi:hypothetical protein